MSLVTLTTPSLDLNNGTQYGLIALDLGPNNREEVWVEPMGSDLPILAKVVNRRTKLTISLLVKGTNVADLQTRVEAVRNQFNGQSNTLSYSIGGVTRVFTTYDSQIDPVPFGDERIMFVAVNQFMIPNWTFQVTRDAEFQSGTTRPLVI